MVAEDILDDAERLVRTYGKLVVRPDMPPIRVHVLKHNDMILDIYTDETRAVDDAHSHMHQIGGDWEVITPNNRWTAVVGNITIYIQAHDLR